MADNVTLDPGAGGAVIAADDVGPGVFFQKVKLDGGGDGSTTPIVAGGGTESSALRVTVASDSTGVLSVDDNGASLTVDGTVTANLAAGTNNIGDVDVLTVPADPFGANADAAATAGAAGSIQAKLRLMTSQLDAIQTAVQTLDNAIAGSEMQVDVLTLPAIPAGTNNIGDVDVASLPGSLAGIADDAAFTVATTPVLPVGFLADQASTDSVNEGDVGAARMTLDRKQIATVAPSSDTEGLDIFRSIDLDETEEEVKATAGKLYGWYIYNDGSSEVYVKLYNATTANVTVGTTTPVMTIPIPATSGANVEFTNGIAFSTAITAAATTGVADNDTGTPAANQVIANLLYK